MARLLPGGGPHPPDPRGPGPRGGRETRRGGERPARARASRPRTSSRRRRTSLYHVGVGERVSVQDLVRLWLEHHEAVVRSSTATVRRYASAAEHLVRFVRQECPALTADALTPGLAERFVKHLRSVKVAPNGHPNSPRRTLRDKGVLFVLEVCRSILNYAAKRRCLPPYARNPFSEIGIERMRVEDAKPVAVVSEAEEQAFLRFDRARGAAHSRFDNWRLPTCGSKMTG